MSIFKIIHGRAVRDKLTDLSDTEILYTLSAELFFYWSLSKKTKFNDSYFISVIKHVKIKIFIAVSVCTLLKQPIPPFYNVKYRDI